MIKAKFTKQNKIYEKSTQNALWKKNVLDSAFQKNGLAGRVQKCLVYVAKQRLYKCVH